jgi:hypothetical protein
MINGRVINDINDLAEDFADSILTREINTIVVDNYLPYSPVDVVKKPFDKNRVYDGMLTKAFEKDFPECLPMGPTGLSLELYTTNKRIDVDNLSLSYIKNMSGIVFGVLEDIQELHLIKSISNELENCKCRIYQ